MPKGECPVVAAETPVMPASFPWWLLILGLAGGWFIGQSQKDKRYGASTRGR